MSFPVCPYFNKKFEFLSSFPIVYEEFLSLIIFALTFYLIGSIPFGFILTKIFGYGDVRKIGSGNIGATNVLRTGNKTLAFATLLLDGSKGIAALFFLTSISYFSISLDYQDSFNLGFYVHRDAFVCGPTANVVIMLAAFLAILGHCFPIWLDFKGGKGVATTFGVLLVAAPYAGIAACLTWIITAKLTKISSLSALAALLIAPIVISIFYGIPAAAICILISALIFFRHKENIKRLINGTEPKIGEKKDAAPKT